jgi:hypothetical protein
VDALSGKAQAVAASEETSSDTNYGTNARLGDARLL